MDQVKRFLVSINIILGIVIGVIILNFNMTNSNWINISKTKIKVNACNLSSKRKANVIVDIGYGNRKYYSITNKYKQLIIVWAKQIKLQTSNEAKYNGRYCKNQANVDITNNKKFDKGHVIADSLGGVSNAYNITPQESNLNRHGKQIQMEKKIIKALNHNDNVSNFNVNILYPNKDTMIPNYYEFSFQINNLIYHYKFANKK